jgi:hypothetical protein
MISAPRITYRMGTRDGMKDLNDKVALKPALRSAQHLGYLEFYFEQNRGEPAGSITKVPLVVTSI